MEFREFSKMARLSRECIITEKIDGTNAQVYIEALDGYTPTDPNCIYAADGLALWAGSRTRWITPKDDNFGFAAWALKNAELLLELGPGRHFGEWWGQGIQRKYGLAEKRFSMFNTIRFCLAGETPGLIPSGNPKAEPNYQTPLPACIGLVPVLYRGLFDTQAAKDALLDLQVNGSKAAPGFMDPEGIVIFHTAGQVGFKKTIKNDESPKSTVKS